MIWYKAHATLADHPKTFRLEKLLGMMDGKNKHSLASTIGYIHLFFTFVLKFAKDGGLDKYNDFEIERGCKWTGEPGIFYKGLVDAGFIRITEHGKVVNDWYEENGKQIRDSERMREYRSRTKQERLMNEMGNGRTDGQTNNTDGQTDHVGMIQKIENALSLFSQKRKEDSRYAKEDYKYSQKDRNAAVGLIYKNTISDEEFLRGLKNYLLTEPTRWNGNHSGWAFFDRFNEFLSESQGPPVGRGGAKGGPQSNGGGSSLGNPFENKRSAVEALLADAAKGNDGAPRDESTPNEKTGGNSEVP